MGSNDLGLLVTAAFIVMGIIILCYMYTMEDAHTLEDWLISPEEIKREAMEEEPPSFWDWLIGAGLSLIGFGGAALGFYLGKPVFAISLGGIGTYWTLTSLPRNMVDQIPILNQMLYGFDWITAAGRMFIKLIILDVPILEPYPIIKLLILGPLWFTMIYIIVKFIRGN